MNLFSTIIFVTVKVLRQKSFLINLLITKLCLARKKILTKKVSKYVCEQIFVQKVIKTFFVTCHMGHVTTDITPDTLHMGLGEHGVHVHVSSCYGFRVKVF